MLFRSGEAASENNQEVLEGALDVAGATFALRNRTLEVGREYAYPVFTGSKSFMMKARVEGKEVLSTAQGRQEVFRLRVYTEFSGSLASKRDTVAWLTSDARHLPVRIEAELSLGSIVAELQDYQQGKLVTPSPAVTAKNDI